MKNLWNWSHLETSHNDCTKQNCSMTPEEFAKEYQVENAFLVSYGGNITPPFEPVAERMKDNRNIKWTILGNSTDPLPESPLGFAEEIIELSKKYPNITGGVIDDFYAPERLKRFPPEVLQTIQKRLAENGLDFWAVLYESHIYKDDVKKYYDCFDGITFWIWEQEHIDQLEENVNRFFSLFPDKRKMVGVYLWDYAGSKDMDIHRFQKQVEKYLSLLEAGQIEGIIFCSGCVGDAPFETNKLLKTYSCK